MHEFCPLCFKNGIKAKVRSYQINYEEAVFMCSTEKCTWPVGYEQLQFINRPIGKEWSETWEKSASKLLKKNDMPFDYFTYTPPQTPGTDNTFKEAPTIYTGCTPVFPVQVCDSLDPINEIKSEVSITPMADSFSNLWNPLYKSGSDLKLIYKTSDTSKLVSSNLDEIEIKSEIGEKETLKANESHVNRKKLVRKIGKPIVKSVITIKEEDGISKNSIKNSRQYRLKKSSNPYEFDFNAIQSKKIKKERMNATNSYEFDFDAIQSKKIKKERIDTTNSYTFDFNSIQNNVKKERTDTTNVTKVVNLNHSTKRINTNEYNAPQSNIDFSKMLDAASFVIKSENDVMVELDRNSVGSSINSMSDLDSTMSNVSPKELNLDPIDVELELNQLLATLPEEYDDQTSDVLDISNDDCQKWIDEFVV